MVNHECCISVEHDLTDKKQHDNESLPLVNVYYRDKQAGLYCARFVGRYTLVLFHGAISFPVGTVLMVQYRPFTERETVKKKVMAIVRHNSTTGMLLGLRAAV